MSDKCQHNNHSHWLIWWFIWLLWMGNCVDGTKGDVQRLESRVRQLEWQCNSKK